MVSRGFSLSLNHPICLEGFQDLWFAIRPRPDQFVNLNDVVHALIELVPSVMADLSLRANHSIPEILNHYLNPDLETDYYLQHDN